MSNDFKDNFRKAVSHVIATHGRAYDPKKDNWGDSRGRSLPEMSLHMKTCAVKSMSDFEEKFSWHIYDTMNNADIIGMKADLTCECGMVQNVQFLVEDANLSTIMGWLLEDD